MTYNDQQTITKRIVENWKKKKKLSAPLCFYRK